MIRPLLRAALILIVCISVAACDGSGPDEPGDTDITGTASVDAQADIFAAGLSTPPPATDSLFEGGSGQLPVLIELPAGADTLRFSDVEGMVEYGGAFGRVSADGGGRDSTDINSYEGISGIVHRDGSFFFLTGVFLNGQRPAVAPERRDASAANQQALFSDLEIGQTFFIGDGRTASGQQQRFVIPAGATRLFLGFADTNREQGPPGAYGDNSGALTVDYRIGIEESMQ